MELLPEGYEALVHRELEDWIGNAHTERLLKSDNSLWTGNDEGDWLGWVNLISRQKSRLSELQLIAAAVLEGEFKDILLLGMGGSSLCAEVLAKTFGSAAGFPSLHILDSTVPAQVLRYAQDLDPLTTLYIVASKSGSTTEPNAFLDCFFSQASEKLGSDAAEHFVAITDPGSSLEARAKASGFRRVVHGIPDVGGRFSAFTDFGLFPASMIGLDLHRYLNIACEMEKACSSNDATNPGVQLGIFLGVLANAGRDKLTLVTSPGLSDFASWLEQLVAESTGKIGKGIIPVDREPLFPPERYDSDRVFAYLSLTTEADPKREKWIRELRSSGHPVVNIRLESRMELGGEFYRWEMATAVAGSVLKVNPFDQPNVQESKEFTADLIRRYLEEGRLPQSTPWIEEDGVEVFLDERDTTALKSVTSLDGCVKAHLDSLEDHDYFSICAYVDMDSKSNINRLDSIRKTVGSGTGAATTLGFGPRFLHSTGQLHKGGPDTGLFIQITAEDGEDLPIPESGFTFGVLKTCQAIGDLNALSARNRRVVRFHLTRGVESGLLRLTQAFQRALPQSC
jgi:glucose-6-phosphate isomerase